MAEAERKDLRPEGRDWHQLSALMQQLPPHAREAEMSLLGSVLVDPAVMGEVVMHVHSSGEFHVPAHALIYEAMLQMYERLNAIDIVQLTQHLRDRQILDSVGGVAYLVELAEAVPSASNAVHYAKIIHDKALIRDLIRTAGDILRDAFTSSDDAVTVLDEAERRIFLLAERGEMSDAASMQNLVHEVMRTIEENEGKLITGVPTGFTDLDEMTHGLQPGEMIILAARPSMGKTAMALNLAEQMAAGGAPVAVFSLEMSRQQLVQRVLSARSGIDSQRLRRGMLSKDDWSKLHGACSELHELPLYIDDSPGLTLMQMVAKSRRLHSRHKVRAVVIDYLQLMSSGRRAESRQVEISEISRGVKAMARELQVPVICLSQLNRAAEQREGHRPRMSDLRESGSIEQDADVVMMLHREEYYHQADPEWRNNNSEKVGLAELIIAKQRNGPTGTVNLTWDSAITRFRNWSGATAPGGYYEAKNTYEPEPAPRASGGNFMAGPRRGPVDEFRDGGGPEEPPF